MKITLVGMGSGTPGSLTAVGLETLRGAELIIGARRLLENLPEGCTANRAALYKTDEICALLRQTDCAEGAVVFSGDTGFYSGAAALCRALDDAGLPYTVLPGVSSVQLLAAALGRPWQGWRLVSAHGVNHNANHMRLPFRRYLCFRQDYAVTEKRPARQGPASLATLKLGSYSVTMTSRPL